MGPVGAAIGTVMQVAADPCSRGGLATGPGEIPRAPGCETFGAAALVDPLHFAERAAVRVSRPGQEVVPSRAHRAVRFGQQSSVRLEGRQRTTLGGGTGVLPVVVPTAEVPVPRVSGLDRQGRRRRAHGDAGLCRPHGRPPLRSASTSGSLAPIHISGYGALRGQLLTVRHSIPNPPTRMQRTKCGGTGDDAALKSRTRSSGAFRGT
jgi:hypothetical protein